MERFIDCLSVRLLKPSLFIRVVFSLLSPNSLIYLYTKFIFLLMSGIARAELSMDFL